MKAWNENRENTCFSSKVGSTDRERERENKFLLYYVKITVKHTMYVACT